MAVPFETCSTIEVFFFNIPRQTYLPDLNLNIVDQETQSGNSKWMICTECRKPELSQSHTSIWIRPRHNICYLSWSWGNRNIGWKSVLPLGHVSTAQRFCMLCIKSTVFMSYIWKSRRKQITQASKPLLRGLYENLLPVPLVPQKSITDAVLYKARIWQQFVVRNVFNFYTI